MQREDETLGARYGTFSDMQTVCQVMHEHACDSNQSRAYSVCVFVSSTPCDPPPMTHRAGYVRAGRPLAVGPRHSGASDFLLLPQQLAVLLLSVLHVDEQRDEAVLHLCARAQKKKPYYIIMITLELQLSIIL